MKRASKTGERRSAAQMHALAAVRREIVSRDASSGRKYLREYTQAFRHYDGVLTAQQLDEKVSAASILLVGDYHALPASQRYAATLIEQLASKRPVVLGVEAVLSRDRPILDSWWRREIGEQELRKRLRFDHDWGYDWEPLCELLTAARDHADGVYGLDCMPREDMRRIRSRDRHAAAKLCEMRQRHPDAALVVLFGESHMAPEHLPRLVQQALPGERVLTILQNVDALYWQAVGENAAAVSTGPESVCVFNSSPLERYESYRLCLERWHGDDQPDFAPAIYNLIFSLARTLGFRLHSPHNGTQPKYLADSLPEVVNVAEASAETGADIHGNENADNDARATLSMIEEQGCAYFPESNTFLISEFRMPHVAVEAARFLHHACRGMSPTRCPLTSDIENALAHFGGRLLSPGSPQEGCFKNEDGEKLYNAYLEGRLTKAAAKRIFLAHLETAAESQAVLSRLRTI
jgi:Haem-binding uptake, Tiki superfamily, ChaN